MKEKEVAPTCTTAGSYDEVVCCSVCGEELSRVTVTVAALGHIYGQVAFENEIAPTCTEPGFIDAVIRCERCGEKLSSATYTIDPKGHNFTEWMPVKMPTCTEDGELRRYCLNCGCYESYILPALTLPDFDFEYREEMLDMLRNLYDMLGDRIFDLMKEHGKADYTIYHDSLYLAIGDSTGLGANSYVNKLAELLEIPHMTQNLAQYGMTIADAIEMVGNQSDLISKADLITLNFSNIAASTAMLQALAGTQTTDWSDAIGKTASENIEKALAELKAKLIAEGMDAETVNMVIDAANAYAYAYAARIMLYPSLVDSIRDVNDDALIVIVGTYNELENVVLDVNGEMINIGEYTKYLIYAANLENLLQAVVGEDVIYVHAPEVETVFAEKDYQDLNNLGYLMSIMNDEMLPTDAGHQYIAEKIFSALNVRYKMWGDVNGDHVVNTCDARLVLRYVVDKIDGSKLDLEMADVNGDGEVDTRDARLILRLCVGAIEHFPVCRFSEE